MWGTATQLLDRLPRDWPRSRQHNGRRSADADIRLDDRYASGIHARVFSRSGSYYVEDMGSTNGTLLNSQELHGEAELHPGDSIRIGDTEFVFEVA